MVAKFITRVGFTGTHRGMTGRQFQALAGLVDAIAPSEVHHGGRLGADAQMALGLLWARPHVRTHLYPAAVGARKRARGLAEISTVVHPPRAPLERTVWIIRNTEALIACPLTVKEYVRSGTWAAVRRARKLGRPVYIVDPAGLVQCERGQLPESLQGRRGRHATH